MVVLGLYEIKSSSKVIVRFYLFFSFLLRINVFVLDVHVILQHYIVNVLFFFTSRFHFISNL